MIRATIPKVTTPGPESHTIFRIGGTLRRAERRSRQLLQTFSFCDIRPESWPDTVRADATASTKMPKPGARFDRRCARRYPLSGIPSPLNKAAHRIINTGFMSPLGVAACRAKAFVLITGVIQMSEISLTCDSRGDNMRIEKNCRDLKQLS